MRVSTLAHVIVLVSGFFVACSKPAEPMGVVSLNVREQCPGNDNTELFFPSAATFSGDEERRRFTTILSRASEPSLSCGASRADAYRVVVIYAVGSIPVIIRITGPGEGSDAEIVTTELGVDDKNRDLLTVTKRSRRRIENTEWHQVTSDLQRLGNWSTSVFPGPRNNSEGTPLDGATWLLEGRDSLGYRAVVRPEHPMAPEFLTVVQTFQRLAGIKR